MNWWETEDPIPAEYQPLPDADFRPPPCWSWRLFAGVSGLLILVIVALTLAIWISER